MKPHERVAALVENGTVEDAKVLMQELMKIGNKQAAVDLYRCFEGNETAGTKRLNLGRVLRLAAVMEANAEARTSYFDMVVANEKALACFNGEHVPAAPSYSRY